MSSPTFKYFAYGSNMCSGRLRARVRCEFITTAKLLGYQLCFHKLSKKDGSSKCDIYRTDDENDSVWGVVYEVPEADRTELNRYEGFPGGYQAGQVQVTLPNGQELTVWTYIAEDEYYRDGLAPYTWYKAWVQAGAAEHGLPQQYVAERISPVVATEDPNKQRHGEETAALQAWEAERSR